MKITLTRLLGAALCVASLMAQAHDDGTSPARCTHLTVFVAKKIYTMDPGRPLAHAVAVCNAHVVGLGDTLDDFKPWIDAIPTTVDRTLADKIVFPGFIDSHQHPLLGSLTTNLPLIASFDTAQPYGPDVKGVKNEAEAVARLHQYDAALKNPNAPLIVWGWDVPAMGRHLTRQDLDRVSTTRPVLVWDASQHHAYVNSVVIAQRKLTKDLDKVGVGHDANGELNGQFLGVPAATFILMPYLMPQLAPAHATHLMRWLIDLDRRNGITTSTDHMVGWLSLDHELPLLDAVYNQPDSPMRLMAIAYPQAFVAKYGTVEKAMDAVHALQGKSTDHLIFHGVKFFTDDSFNGLTFKPGGAGYVDGHEGLWITPPENLEGLMEPWWNDGQQIFVHSIGTEAQDLTLSALRRLEAEHPRVDHRFTFEHVGMARYDQIRAMKALGANANVNIYYIWLRGEMYPGVVGQDRAEDLSPLGSLVREGVPTTVHSDYPVAPPRPLLAITLAMTRLGQSGDKTLGAGQTVTLDQALRMVTIDAAYVLGLDNKVGSLEPGKLADFTVLERDPHEVKPAAIRDIPVWGTVLGGRVFPASEIKAR